MHRLVDARGARFKQVTQLEAGMGDARQAAKEEKALSFLRHGIDVLGIGNDVHAGIIHAKMPERGVSLVGSEVPGSAARDPAAPVRRLLVSGNGEPFSDAFLPLR